MEVKKISVSVEGLSSVMFDKFYDHSNENRPPERKFYTDNPVCLPVENIYSFLYRDAAPVGAVRFVEKRKAKEYLAMGQAFMSIRQTMIPFLDESYKPILFNGFGKFDSDSRFYVNDWEAGITKMSGGKIIKQEARPRPVMKLPWNLEFEVMLFENDKVTPDKLLSWFQIGGLVIAIGTHRPQYGRFMIKKWKVE